MKSFKLMFSVLIFEFYLRVDFFDVAAYIQSQFLSDFILCVHGRNLSLKKSNGIANNI
jgi:hypothetical protein